MKFFNVHVYMYPHVCTHTYTHVDKLQNILTSVPNGVGGRRGHRGITVFNWNMFCFHPLLTKVDGNKKHHLTNNPLNSLLASMSGSFELDFF